MLELNAFFEGLDSFLLHSLFSLFFTRTVLRYSTFFHVRVYCCMLERDSSSLSLYHIFYSKYTVYDIR